jgi:uncharacterized protein (DUF1697 family)
MTTYVALLRAVNVGGAGKLPMADLRAKAVALGFANVRTFIASGNLLFESALDEGTVKAMIEARLADYAGKRVPVLVRSAAEMAAVVAADPFPQAHGSRHMVFFYDTAPAPDLIAGCRDVNGERLALGSRELYIDYGDGIRFTKLKIPGKEDRTGRNMNSVKTMAGMMGLTGTS